MEQPSDERSINVQELDELQLVKHHLSISKYCLFRVSTYDSTLKELYVFDIGKSQSIIGLVLERINQSSKPVWQVQELKFKSLQFLKYSNPPIDTSSLFIKYGWDRIIHLDWSKRYDTEMFYPVYRIGKLPLQGDHQANLQILLEDIGSKQQDWDKDSSILQIIDPDLNPNYFIEKPPKQESKPFQIKGIIKNLRLINQGRSDSSQSHQDSKENYLWFPVDILLKPDNQFDVLGEIHNLVRKGNENLYECIFSVFKEMLSGFRKLKVLNNKQHQKIQVVIKAQKIIIRQGIKFEEDWHLEGQKEEVVAGGVYVCKMQPNIENQFMAFIPKKYPIDIESKVGALEEITVPVNEHSAIVFENSIPHRLFRIEKGIPVDSEILTISFFIIDPNIRLETNQIRTDVFNILKTYTNLPKVIIDEILSYIYSNLNLDIAKEKREHAKDLMQGKRSFWILCRDRDDNTGYNYLYHNNC